MQSRGRDVRPDRRRKFKTAVWPIEVVIGCKLPEHSYQVALVEDNDVVQAFSPQGPRQSLRDRVGLRRPIRSPDPNHAKSGEPGVEVFAVDVVAVVDQVARLSAPGSCIDQLLPDPGRGGIGGDVQVHEFTPAVTHKEQDIQRPETDRLHHQEVGGPDPLRLIAQERPPGLTWRAIRRPGPISTDRARTNRDAQLEELPADALRPPGRIFERHSPDEGSHLRAESWSPEPGSGPPRPIESPTSAVPANHGLGSHQDEVPRPRARTKSTDPDPQDPVPIA